MSARAKSVAAAFGAVVFAAITAWQSIVGSGGFRTLDLLPLAVVVVGAIQTHVIPNVPELPWAKSVVAGSSAVLTALATAVAADPSGVTAGKLLTVAASAFLVWFVPELAPAPAGPDGVPDISSLPKPPPEPVEITDALAALDPQPTAVPASPDPVTAPIPVVAPAPAPVTEPTPIGDAAASAARALSTDTAAMPAVVPNPNMAA